jgi:methylglutaconyl-CoA hydratase
MNQAPLIFFKQSPGIAVCVLNRPDKRNALSVGLMRQFCGYITRTEEEAIARVLILRGSGSVFCSGLDISEVMDPELGIESARMVRQCLSKLCQTPLTTLAEVRGAAMGGGAGLVAACDFAVADKNASIGFPEVRRGLIPAQVMSVLVRKLRGADIRELLLTGEPVGAQRAMQMGLFNRVGDVESETSSIISGLLASAPGAIARTKRLLDMLYARRLEDDLDECIVQYEASRESPEGREGVQAFLRKRKPFWHSELFSSSPQHEPGTKV